MNRMSADYGKGTHTIEEDTTDGEALIAQLREHFASSKYQPPVLPSVALEVHEMARQPDVELGRMAALLEKDSMLAAKVLRVAQSAIYVTSTPIQSLRHAVIRLGIRTLRDIVWEIALNMRIFRAKEYAQAMESVRRHSTVTAYFSKIVSAQTSIAVDYAFLCGLLHDIGAAATLIVLSEQPKLQIAQDSPILVQVVRDFHEEASGVIAKMWNLPADVQLVLQSHHTLDVGGHPHPLSCVVCIAQEFASTLGAPIQLAPDTNCDSSSPETLAKAYTTLGLKDAQILKIREEAARVLPSIE